MVFRSNAKLFIYLKLILIFSISLFVSNHSYAQLITYEKFTQLERKEQIEVVKMIHEFVAHTEYVQMDYLTTKEKNKRYSRLIESFNILFNYAYANNNATIIQPSTDAKSQVCVYGGWISVMPLDSKGSPNGKCTHPQNIVDNSRLIPKNPPDLEQYETSMSQEYKGYIQGEHLKDKDPKTKTKFIQIIKGNIVNGKRQLIYKESNSCPQKGMIVCAPSIFGTHPSGSIFCATGNNSSQNTSYLCAQGVAKHPDHSKILENLVSQILQGDETKKKEFNYMMMTMYDTCMCKGDTGMMNKDYAKKMFGHRTCFAWMYQSKRILETLNASQNCNANFDKYDYSQSNGLATMSDWFKKAQETIKEQMQTYEARDTEGSYFDLDKKIDKEFQQSREASYAKYKEQKICPLMIAPSIKIEISGSHTEQDWYIVTATFVGVSKSADSITGWKFSKKGSDGEIKDDGKAEDNKFLVKKIDKPYTITATVKDINPPGELLIPKRDDDPKISIALGERKESIQKVNATVTGVDGKDHQIVWSPTQQAQTQQGQAQQAQTQQAQAQQGQTQAQQTTLAASTAPQKVYDAQIKEEKYKVKATLVIGGKNFNSNEVEIAPNSTCSIAKKSGPDEKDNIVYQLTLNGVSDDKIKKIEWTPADKFNPNPGDKAKEVTIKDPKTSLTIGATVSLNGDKGIPCPPVTYEPPKAEEPSDLDYKISIKKKVEGDESDTFEASVTLANQPVTDTSGLTIQWFKYNASAAPAKPAESSNPIDREREKRAREEGVQSEARADSSPRSTSAGTGKTVAITKTNKVQKVFAKLIGQRVKPNTKSNELTVAKKKKETPPPKADNSNPIQRPPVQAPRPMINFGIRQGVQ